MKPETVAAQEEEPGEQGEVIWQGNIRPPLCARRDAPVTRLSRVVRHKVTRAADAGRRDDAIIAEVFGHDARGRSRWEDAGDLEATVLKAALMAAHITLDHIHNDDGSGSGR